MAALVLMKHHTCSPGSIGWKEIVFKQPYTKLSTGYILNCGYEIWKSVRAKPVVALRTE